MIGKRWNNPKGNPEIAAEGRKWRERTSNWKELLAQISRERSSGPKSDIGKFKSSLNAQKYPLESLALRISPNSMMGQLLTYFTKESDKKKNKKNSI
ncbi:MAG: hypothetical protein AABX00_00360 [Nanoarchaeota archaeon]